MNKTSDTFQTPSNILSCTREDSRIRREEKDKIFEEISGEIF